MFKKFFSQKKKILFHEILYKNLFYVKKINNYNNNNTCIK